MKLKFSFLAAAFLCASFSSQTIMIDTVVPNNPAPSNSIVEYWYWAYGVNVVGSGFASNSTVNLTATAPDQTKRTLTTVSDENGNVETRFNGMKINSITGSYSLSAVDGSGSAATGTYSVFKNPLDVITATARPAEFKINQFSTGSVINVDGFSPNAPIKINIEDPAGNAWEFNQNRQMFADDQGKYEFKFDKDTPLFTGNQPIALQPVEGQWSLSFFDFSNAGFTGSKKVRVLPVSSGTSSYGAVTTIISEPIVNVEFATIKNLTDPNSENSYEDFTSIIGDVKRGQEYTMNLRGNTNGEDRVSTFTAFIDWNQNGILDEDNEVYSIGSVKGTVGFFDTDQAAINKITIPADAVLGNTRMRILKVNSFSDFALFWPTGASGTYYSGQIEDYTLKINDAALATNENAALRVQLYPNPVVNILTVSTDKKVNSIMIFDASGKLLKTNLNSNSIDMSAFSKGMYIVRTEIAGKIQSTKVIKK